MPEFEQVPAVRAGKRLGVDWQPWMDDWFVSHSPRNSNSEAEGQWGQWVDLALRILQDPLTKLTRPEAYEAVAALEQRDFYDGTDRELTEDELRERFRR